MSLRIRQSAFKGVWTKTIVFSLVFVFVAQYVGIQVSRQAAALSAHSVVINEILPAKGAGEKWVELYNASDSSLDISNWRLTRGSGNVGAVIPADTLIAEHGFYIVSTTESLPLENADLPLRLQTGPSEDSVVDSVDSWNAPKGKSYARSNDGGGEWRYGKPTKGATNDITPPEVTFLTPQDNPQKNLTVNVRIADDNLRQISFDVTRLSDGEAFRTRKIMIDEGQTELNLNEYDLCAASIVHAKAPDCDESWISNGPYRIRAKAYGSKGPANTSVVRNISVDTTAPTLNASLEAQRTNGYVTDNDFAIEGKAGDEESGLNKVIIVLQRSGKTTIESGNLTLEPQGGFKFSLNDVSDGDYNAYVSAWDRAGNKTEYPAINFTVDTQAPVINITSPVEGQTVGGELNVKGGITDATAVNYGYVIKDAAGVARRSDTSLHDTTFDRTIGLADLSSGKYAFILTASDASGHTTSSAPIVFLIDHTAPQLTISGPKKMKLDGTASFTIVSSEPLAGHPLVFINGVLFDGTLEQVGDVEWQFRYTPPSVATYSVTAAANDTYGNPSSSQYTGASFVLNVIANPPTTDQTSSANSRLQSAATALARPLVVNTPPEIKEKSDVEKPAVLGTETAQGEATDVPVIASSDKGWQFMGVAWYWILLALAAVAAVWRTIATYRRNQLAE